MTNAEARFNNSLRPRKPEGSLGRTAQDGHLDSHTTPELWLIRDGQTSFNVFDNASLLFPRYGSLRLWHFAANYKISIMFQTIALL